MRPHDGGAGALDALEAIGVLAEHGCTHVAPHVAALLVRSVGGEPDAVVETARLLTAEQLAGTALVPDPLPAVAAVRSAVRPLLADVPVQGRRLLLVAAVSVVDRTDVLLRASSTDLDALLEGPAVRCLDLVAGHARLRDERVRSVVHDEAGVAERTAAHRSLAAVHEADGHHDVATWHRALACLAGEPDVALPLAEVAEGMLGRGEAVWAQRVALEAVSHADPPVRSRALAVAGRAALHAGHVADAADLLREALRTCDPQDAPGLRTALLVAVSHLTGQVPDELADPRGSGTSRVVARVLHAARGESTPVARVARPSAAAPGPDDAGLGGGGPGDAGSHDAGPGDPGPEIGVLADATVSLLAGAVPPALPASSAGEPIRAAMVGVLRAVALAGEGQADAARSAVVSVLAGLTPLPGDRAWAPQRPTSTLPDARVRAMTPLVEAHVRLLEALVETWAGNLVGARAAIERSALRLPLGLCVHGAAAVVAGRVCVLADGERGPLAEALERLVPLPHSPLVRAGLLTDRALALLLRDEAAPSAATLLDLCAERSGSAGLPLPTLRAPEVRLVLDATPPGPPTTVPDRAAPVGSEAAGGGVGDLAEALMPGAAARLVVACGDLAGVVEALASSRRHANPLEQGLTRLVVGQALTRAGRTDEGAEHLRAAGGLLEDAGAGAVARLAHRLLGRPGPTSAALRLAGAPTVRGVRRTRPVPAAPWAGPLTEREVEVALVVADGTSNRVAARHLGLSERTVEVHLTNIFRKLGVTSRTELALLVSRAEHVG